MRLVCCLVLVLGGLELTSALLVGAWNIQTFGRSKANLINSSPRKADILKHIATVIRRYDIIVLQEVRDSTTNPDGSVDVINALMAEVNRNQAGLYAEIHSGPLGGNQERYLYLYRAATVRATARQYNNPGTNTFDRPPFIARFQNRGGQHFDYTFIPLHASPVCDPPCNAPRRRSTVQELDSLADVKTYINRLWNTNNILLLGDFNAGCTYVKRNQFQNIRLWTQTADYRVLIDHNVQTNVPPVQTPCPYDRIVATTPMMVNVVAGTAKIFDFVHQWTPVTPPPVPAREISDHYPVEVVLTP